MGRWLTGLSVLALALAGCDANRSCTKDSQCRTEERCRIEVRFCSGTGPLAVVDGGYCRDVGSSCASNDDCVPTETCQPDGFCHPDSALCQNPPACPASCPLVSPYPCACVCPVCPSPDGGV